MAISPPISGVVELTIALHRMYDFSHDRFLWDVGHQAYPHKLLTGELNPSLPTAKRAVSLVFPTRKKAPMMLPRSAIAQPPSVQGLASLRRASASAMAVRPWWWLVMALFTGGMCFEGLINAGELNSNMLVVLNDNGNFIDPPVGSLHHHLDRGRSGKWYSRLRERFLQNLKRIPYGDELGRLAEHFEHLAHKTVSPGYIFEDLGFRYFGPIDGHNRKQVEQTLEKLHDMEGPVLLHVHTEKGGGWQPSLDDPLTYHSGKNFNLDTGEFLPAPPSKATFSDMFAEVLIETAENDPHMVAVTAAMPTGTGLAKFGKVYPDRMIDVGICEQHSFAFVQGLATAELHPVLAHYSTFAQRGYDQLFQELVVQRDLGVVVTLDRAGMVGEDGETHQGLYDIAWSRTLPGTVLMAPKDGTELKNMFRWAHMSTYRATRATTRSVSDSLPERGGG